MVVFPNCKINLGLHILQKREDGYHNLETVFYPVPLHDALEAVHSRNGEEELQLTLTGFSVDVKTENNICVKAYRLLKKDFPQLPSLKMHLHKTIPAGAGLGGGSADGTFTLLLLNKKFNLGIKEDQLLQYAALLGSDCPFFIKNKPCYATGRGEVLEDWQLDLSAYKLILVHPRIAINTAWAFSQIVPQQNSFSLKQIIAQPVTAWANTLVNDFEPAVFPAYPEIEKIKTSLYQSGALYASLTGTGSTVYGIFVKDQPADLRFPSHYFVKEC